MTHAISNGVVTFKRQRPCRWGRWETDVAAAVQYLRGGDLGNAGASRLHRDAAGVTHTFLYQQVGSAQNAPTIY